MFVNLEIRNDDIIWIIITPGNDTEEIALKHIMQNLGFKKGENTFKLSDKTIIKFEKKGQLFKENTLFGNQLGQYPWLKKP